MRTKVRWSGWRDKRHNKRSMQCGEKSPRYIRAKHLLRCSFRYGRTEFEYFGNTRFFFFWVRANTETRNKNRTGAVASSLIHGVVTCSHFGDVCKQEVGFLSRRWRFAANKAAGLSISPTNETILQLWYALLLSQASRTIGGRQQLFVPWFSGKHQCILGKLTFGRPAYHRYRFYVSMSGEAKRRVTLHEQ